MPRRLELSPDDRHLAYLAGKGAPAELIMVDLGDGTVSRHALSPAQVGQLLWVQARRVLLAPLSPQQPAVVFDTTLKQRSTMPTWAFAFGTVRRGIAWTLDQQGVLSRANLARGTVRNVADFGSTGVGVVISTG
jgi:hypothetical protein